MNCCTQKLYYTQAIDFLSCHLSRMFCRNFLPDFAVQIVVLLAIADIFVVLAIVDIFVIPKGCDRL